MEAGPRSIRTVPIQQVFQLLWDPTDDPSLVAMVLGHLEEQDKLEDFRWKTATVRKLGEYLLLDISDPL